MAFRKASYSKVFVDDAIPSFLVERIDTRNAAPKIASATAPTAAPFSGGSVSLSPALAGASSLSVAMAPKKDSAETDGHNAALPHERRNRSFQLRPRFMLRIIMVTIALNISLHFLLNILPPLLPALVPKLASPLASPETNVSATATLSPADTAISVALRSNDADAPLDIITYQSGSQEMLHDVALQPNE